MFFVFYNILVNIQKEDLDKNPGGKKPNKNNKRVDITDNQYNRQGYNITKKNFRKQKQKRIRLL
jgi:hypothetical protein